MVLRWPNKSLPSSVARFPFNVKIDDDFLFTTNGRGFDGHDGGTFSNTYGGAAMYDTNDDLCNVSVRPMVCIFRSRLRSYTGWLENKYFWVFGFGEHLTEANTRTVAQFLLPMSERSWDKIAGYGPHVAHTRKRVEYSATATRMPSQPKAL